MITNINQTRMESNEAFMSHVRKRSLLDIPGVSKVQIDINVNYFTKINVRKEGIVSLQNSK